jgi:hypothetical protein
LKEASIEHTKKEATPRIADFTSCTKNVGNAAIYQAHTEVSRTARVQHDHVRQRTRLLMKTDHAAEQIATQKMRRAFAILE